MNYFINFSNHPADKWDDKQIRAARFYGEVISIPFPNIPAIYRPEDLRYEVSRFAAQIQHYIKPGNHVTIHIMGEMTFTYMVVDYFRDYENVTCTASTTERKVEEKDGVKISKFEFIQFREYARF